MSVIRIRLEVRFPGYLLQVNQSLPGKGVTGIFGVSGSGKSTLLRAIAGLERPVNSRIVIGDEIWHDDEQGIFLPPYKRPLGFVFQDAALFPHLTVRKNLEYGLKRVPEAARCISLDYVADLLGLAPLMDRKPQTLSGGEKQRVGIARALATSPRILMMDEPLSSLDLPRKAEIIPYLNRLNAELSIPILYVSHDLDEISSLADHLILLEAGKIRASDKIEQLLTRLDLPLAHRRDAAAIIQGTAIEREERFHLNTIAFGSGRLCLPGAPIPAGKPVRLRIHANDVSLALSPATDTSILNLIPARVVNLHENENGLVIVELDTGGARLLSRITARSAFILGISPGKTLYAQVKGIAIPN
ncbi:MAG: molybdenum ABC transporter ATP-binding protein [Oxalobacter formigenes]|nr:molybdenum ABC transporter ATP-binding protein [Oxalobacter formigenes]